MDTVIPRSNPVKLTFSNIKYEVASNDGKKKKNLKADRQLVIKDASGYAIPGETLFIMGASGAGKTTLLNALAQRVDLSRGNKLTGDLMLNDTIPFTPEIFSKVGAYVMQDDVLFRHFTPREAITFAARLKLNDKTKHEQDARVEELIKELGISNSADTPIGSAMKKLISGGERKRTAIAVEMVTDPSLLILDEPTSGLDSVKATSLVKILKKQALKGMTVISTIHSPNSKQFENFDKLILMANGHIVY